MTPDSATEIDPLAAPVATPAQAGAGRGFRSEINGLRAIAIAAVVAFHLANGAAPGVVAGSTGAVLVDPLDGLCAGGLCPVTVGGRTLYKDYGHFRASMMTLPRFGFLDPWLEPTAAPCRLIPAVRASAGRPRCLAGRPACRPR